MGRHTHCVHDFEHVFLCWLTGWLAAVLDSDVLLMEPVHDASILFPVSGKSLYQKESMDVNRIWWVGVGGAQVSFGNGGAFGNDAGVACG
jgi:hypothetical protein